jgi:hypothetical protein
LWVRLSVGANISTFNGVVLRVVGGVPIDSETSMVTSSILRMGWLVLEDTHRVWFARVHL